MGLYSIEPLSESQVELIKSSTGETVTCVDRASFLDVREEHAKVSALICRDRDNVSKIIELCPNLVFLYIVSAGVEKLPFDLLKKKNIVVCNAGGVNAEIMSQYAIAYILAQSARVCENLDNQRNHRWKKFQCVDDLAEKTLLIIGAGKVGAMLARKASAFGMRIVGIKNNVCSVPGFDKVVGLMSLNEELPKADFVICTIPLTPLTKGLFDAKRFSLMKPSATFINISRGGVVDESSLVNALQTNIIRSAVLDVFDKEPLPPDSPLWNCRGLFVTPHSSGRLECFMDAAIAQFVTNFNAYCSGDPLPNKVDLVNGY